VRSDGERQLTMDGRPLYLFSGDRAPVTSGQRRREPLVAMTPSVSPRLRIRLRLRRTGRSANNVTVVQTRFGPVVANSRGQVLYTYPPTPRQRVRVRPTGASWTGHAPTTRRTDEVPVDQRTRRSDQRRRRDDPGDTGPSPLYTFAGDLIPGRARSGNWRRLVPHFAERTLGPIRRSCYLSDFGRHSVHNVMSNSSRSGVESLAWR